MIDKQINLACRLVDLAEDELDSILKALRDKDIVFARVLCARVETDLGILKDLLHQEE